MRESFRCTSSSSQVSLSCFSDIRFPSDERRGKNERKVKLSLSVGSVLTVLRKSLFFGYESCIPWTLTTTRVSAREFLFSSRKEMTCDAPIRAFLRHISFAAKWCHHLFESLSFIVTIHVKVRIQVTEPLNLFSIGFSGAGFRFIVPDSPPTLSSLSFTSLRGVALAFSGGVNPLLMSMSPDDNRAIEFRDS